MDRDSVKIVHAALDEVEGREIILRGVIDPDSLVKLQVAGYQREIAPRARILDLVAALKSGGVPDIELGMRGQQFFERDDAYYLQNPVFIVDGLQRVTAGRVAMQEGIITAPRIGAAIRFETTEEQERERFRILNINRQKLSPSVLLRNMRPEFEVMRVLYNLTTDHTFVLHSRVSWGQRMVRGNLITALTYLKSVGALHRRFGPGASANIAQLVPAVQKTMERVGVNIFRQNIRVFFETVDAAWGIRTVTFKEAAVQLRTSFLGAVALLFVRHQLFWDGRRLEVPRDKLQQLSQFPITDPHVKDLTASGGSSAGRLLYELLLDHMNRYKRSRRLVADFND